MKLGTEINDRITEKLGEVIGEKIDTIRNRPRVYSGKNALKDFIDFNKDTNSPLGRIDVNQTDLKDFACKCRKNHVSFAVVKDKADPRTIHFFFQGKNAETMSYLFEEYTKEKFEISKGIENKIEKDEIKKKKELIEEKLKKNAAKTKSAEEKVGEKIYEKIKETVANKSEIGMER